MVFLLVSIITIFANKLLVTFQKRFRPESLFITLTVILSASVLSVWFLIKTAIPNLEYR